MALNGFSCADMLLVGIYSLARCPLRNNQYADCAIQQLQMSVNAESSSTFNNTFDAVE